MDNSSNIAFGLIVGFVVFITVRGELPAYLCVIGIGSNCPPPPSSQNAPPPASTSQQPNAPVQTGGSGGGGNGGNNYPVSIVTTPPWDTSVIDFPPSNPSGADSSTTGGFSTDSTITYDTGGGDSTDPYAGLPDYTSTLNSGYQILPAGLE